MGGLPDRDRRVSARGALRGPLEILRLEALELRARRDHELQHGAAAQLDLHRARHRGARVPLRRVHRRAHAVAGQSGAGLRVADFGDAVHRRNRAGRHRRRRRVHRPHLLRIEGAADLSRAPPLSGAHEGERAARGSRRDARRAWRAGGVRPAPRDAARACRQPLTEEPTDGGRHVTRRLSANGRHRGDALVVPRTARDPAGAARGPGIAGRRAHTRNRLGHGRQPRHARGVRRGERARDGRHRARDREPQDRLAVRHPRGPLPGRRAVRRPALRSDLLLRLPRAHRGRRGRAAPHQRLSRAGRRDRRHGAGIPVALERARHVPSSLSAL
ncbi:hypothetical protein BURPS1710b_A1302 [Burkholderia pseudomallei 1710b]|uniref:Uncharacterized protein n=1 Tax=Burkholderia pseudomallei (strain 1710b) TaxID=320372 RepID=Q3JIZ4_BURP1|nr:hypothetical protein BURPS1710b_A1302 [Burkholderia pseudomallei 1710b]